MNVNRLSGTRRRAFCDPFYIECRANGSLAQQGLNGKIFRFCYGWTDVPAYAEMEVASRFNIQPCLWDRPDSAKDQRVRGILFEWVDGEILSPASITQDIASQARVLLRELHQAHILWCGLAVANFLVENSNSERPILHLLDLSASITLPHIKFSAQQLEQMQQDELQLLEVGFALLSQNQSVRVAHLSDFGRDLMDKESQFIQHLWAPVVAHAPAILGS